MRTIRTLQLLGFALLLSGSTAAASPKVIHKNVLLGFPETAGDFSRGKVTKYDLKGKDVGIKYNQNGLGKEIRAMIYIYPLAREEAELDIVMDEIRELHPGLSKVKKSPISAQLGERKLDGQSARFVVDDVFDEKVTSVVGAVWLFRQGNYWIKIRYSAPETQSVGAEGAIRDLLAHLQWEAQ